MRIIRQSLRGLANNPGFTVVAMLTLALGIGANTAIFSIVNGVLLKPLPFAGADRLVAMNNSYPADNLPRASTSPADYADYRKKKDLFEEVASVNSVSFNLSGQGQAERLAGGMATASLFPMLGVRPIAGRLFAPDEDTPGRDQVVVLDEGLWKRRFGGDISVIGQKIVLNDKPYEVVGVIPPALGFLSQTDIWVPAAFTPEQLDPARRGNQYLMTIGKLRDGLSIGQARAAVKVLESELLRANPNSYLPGRWGLVMTPLTELISGQLAQPLFLLLGAVGFVLLIACTNVANLVLARGAARSREIAIRMAMGATRANIARQVLGESLVLALLSGAAGLAAGWACMRGLVALAPPRFPRIQDVQIDSGVLLFTLVVTLATGVLFGLLPALQAARGNVHNALKEGGRGGAGRRSGWVRTGLVVAEVAVSTLLLVGAGLLLRSFLELQKVSPGFEAGGLVSFRVALPESRFDTPEKSAALFERLRERVLVIPGVKNVGVVSSMPFSGNNSSGSFSIEGRVVPEGESSPHADVRNVNWDYFRTMGMRLQDGRTFSEMDRADTELVALVDEKLAAQYWPGMDPIGQRITRFGRSSGRWSRIVGIVSHVKHSKLDAESKGALYFPLPQMRTQTLNVMVRSAVDPASLADPIRRELAVVDSTLPVYDLRTMQDRVLDSMLPQRVAAWLLGGLSIVALLLAAVGIYGVLSQTVLQRRPEIGIRMALGARRGQVLQLILRQGMTLVSVGLLIGGAAAAMLMRGLQKLLFAVKPHDSYTYAGVVAVLGLVAAIACLVPAFRASRVDPLVALRYE